MTDIKRVHYTTGQFLTATDFTREQDYHLGMHRRALKALRGHGIVEGLEVTQVDDGHLTISPGWAIDAQGRDIVLIDPASVDVTTQPAGRHFVVIDYSEVFDDADKVQIGGADVFTATTERPRISVVAAGVDANGNPADPDPSLTVLIWLFMDPGKIYGTNLNGRTISPLLVPAGAVMAADSITAGGTISAASVTSNGAVYGSTITANWELCAAGGVLVFNAPNTNPGNLGPAGGPGMIAVASYAPSVGGMEIWGWDPTYAQTNVERGRFISMHHNVSVSGSLSVLRSISPPIAGYLNVDGPITGNGGATITGKVTVGGDVTVYGTLIASKKGGFLMDRFINRLGEPLEIGDVVVIGEAAPTLAYGADDEVPVPEVDLTDQIGDTRVCGVVCEVHGDLSGDDGAMRRFTEEERAQGTFTAVQPGQLGHMVTMGAFSFCKVDADAGAIRAGDLLTTGSRRGHAQKVADRRAASGAIIGKALAPLAAGQGKIPILVMLA